MDSTVSHARKTAEIPEGFIRLVPAKKPRSVNPDRRWEQTGRRTIEARESGVLDVRFLVSLVLPPIEVNAPLTATEEGLDFESADDGMECPEEAALALRLSENPDLVRLLTGAAPGDPIVFREEDLVGDGFMEVDPEDAAARFLEGAR